MASETTNYKLIKPDEDDFYDIGVFNANADAIDREIKTVSTPEFEDYEADGMEVPSAEEAMASIVKGKSLGELFGNLKAFCKGVVTLGRLVNNFETTEPGYALDARAGKRLFDEITKLNSDYPAPVLLAKSTINANATLVSVVTQDISPYRYVLVVNAINDNQYMHSQLIPIDLYRAGNVIGYAHAGLGSKNFYCQTVYVSDTECKFSNMSENPTVWKTSKLLLYGVI